MTLKEKLRHSLTGHLSDEKTEVDVNIAEKIAEDFAIEFVEWKDKISTQDLMYSSKYAKSNKELLEIYKKEQTTKCEYCGLENDNHKLSCPVIKITMIL